MSDKDDLFSADEEFGDLESDDFFSDDPVVETKAEEPKEEAAPKKVKVPQSVTKATEEAPAEEEAEETEEAEDEPIEANAQTTDAVEESEEAEEPEEEAEEPEEETAEPEEEEPKAAAPKKAAPKKAAPKKGKRAVKPLSLKQKAVNNILRKAGIEEGELPTLDQLMRCKQGTKIKVSDIAVFISEPEDEVLKGLFKDMSILNRVNLSAEVDLNRVKVVGGQVIGAGRMYQPIQVGKIEEDGRLECTSGRHRLIALALMYGTDIEIPVYIEDMNINEARDAVVVANMARKAKAMEQAEHAVLAAVGGDIDADQDEIYAKTVTTKAKAKKYCTYSVLERGKPIKLAFPLGSPKEGGLARIGTLEGYWGNALDWHRDMARKDFDQALKLATEFINELAAALQKNTSFESSQHMAAMTMKAIGKYYKTMSDANADMDKKFVDKLVNVIVAMGDIGRQKSEETYAAIVKAMK